MKRKRNEFLSRISKNSITTEGGTIKFEKPVVITDGAKLRSGAKYDIESMDIGKYNGTVTVDHNHMIQAVVAKTKVKKEDDKVVISDLKFAIEENPLAKLTHDLIVNGFVKDLSVETIGPWADEDGVFYDSELVGLSIVVVGNNRSAKFNEIVENSIRESEQDGFDTTPIKLLYSVQENEIILEEEKMEEKKVLEENAVPVMEAPAVEAKEDKLAEAVLAINSRLDSIENEIVNKSAKEPEFGDTPAPNVNKNEVNGMDWEERTAEQIKNGWDWLKGGSPDARKKLASINSLHLDLLKEKGIVKNQITIGDMGNFVISPELLSEIEGHRSDFTDFLSTMDWRETLSLQMAWLERDGDVDMQEVEMCDDGEDGNLKPISTYDATPRTSNLKEVAAVTPVCNAATRFLAIDLLADVAQGYRTDYDRKKAQIAVARMQQAVDTTGNSIDYSASSDLASLKSWIEVWGEAQEEIMGGTYIFSLKTYAKLLSAAVGAGISGPLANLFTTGDQPTLLGNRYIVVPNELLPTLGTSETRQFVVEGSTVTIHDAVFYFDPSTVTGRTSGGLQYDLSTEASYEVNGDTRSAFQRNELVLRGSMFRGAAVKDRSKVVGLGTAGLS